MKRFLTVVTVSVTLTLFLTTLPSSADSESLVALGPTPMTSGMKEAFDTLPSVTPFGAFVHFSNGSTEQQRELLEGHGLLVTSEYPQINVLFAVGTIGEIRGLTREPSVIYLEENKRLTFHGDTATWASRSRVVQEAASGGPYRDASGEILVGSDIGVAVVDSGIDGMHPDLQFRVRKNYKIVCPTPGLISTETEQCFGEAIFVDVTGLSSDNTSGHGTHVAGIVAGDGTNSTGPYPVATAAPNVKGTFTGVAPGATLYGFGTGEVIAVLYATEAFQYIYDHYDEFSPRIKIVNNSWGDPAGSQYDPNSVMSKLVKSLVEEKDVTFIFSAGNSGSGSGAPGSADRTSSTCKDPTPGVICVANYDDTFTPGSASGHGYRDGGLNSSSSRGLAGSPITYPDVTAPGTFYTSSCIRQVQPVCNAGIIDEVRWAPWYASISGTSMASPHTAGAAALLLQARPELKPVQVEDILQDTAHKFTAGGSYVADPQNAGSTTSFDKGAGLIDVPAALTALGVAGTGGTAATEPSVRITEPGEGETFDGSTTINVAGTAQDGTSPTAIPAEQVILDGDFDPRLPGAADIIKLTVQETPAGVIPEGLSYRMTLRDANDFGLAPSIPLRVTQNVNGRPFTTNVNTSPTSVSPGTGTALATSADRTGNVVSFFVPLANLGNPPAGSPAHNVFASAFIGVIVDLAPSPQPGAGADVIVRPMFGRPYTIQRPEIETPPTAGVTVSLDGGPEQSATLTGSSPSYSWTAPSIDPSSVGAGFHALTSRLYLNGELASAHSVTFNIESPFTYGVSISSPSDGSTVERGPVTVSGTSATDDPSNTRRVTVALLGQDPMAETEATGADSWSTVVNFDRTPGTYTIVARLYVDGATQASDEISVTIPPEVNGGTVSCAPGNVRFWRQQYGSGNSPGRFTAPERETLLERAVTLSDGVFQTNDELRQALLYNGKPDATRVAAKQFAALLLNLSAGELSANMSRQAGLSGEELLDPTVYNTAVLGNTVSSAASWIRSQFPSGDLGGAAEVANAINNGQGLIC